MKENRHYSDSHFFILCRILFFSLNFFLISISANAHSSLPEGLDFKTRKALPRWLEIEPFVGEYLGNRLDNSFVTGGRVGVRVSDAVSLGVELDYSRIQFDPASSFGSSVKNKNEYLGLGYFSYTLPILQRAGKAIQEADLFTTIGIGGMRINQQNRVVGMIGGGLKLYTSLPWLAVRFDVNTYLYSLPMPNGSKFADDWAFNVGPSFLFLPKKNSEKNE